NASPGSTNDFIYKVPYTVSAGAVTLQSATALYSGAGAGFPGPIATDPNSGVFYVGDLGNGTASPAIKVGSLTGSFPLSQVFSVASTSNPQGLYLLSTPTVSVTGNVSFAQGGSAVALATSLTLANPDGQNLKSATVSITGGSGDTLAATGTSAI